MRENESMGRVRLIPNVLTSEPTRHQHFSSLFSLVCSLLWSGILTACHVSGVGASSSAPSTTGTTNSGGGGGGSSSTPFQANWTFGSAAQYTYDSTKIDFTGGVGELTAITHADTDDTASGFGGGTLYGVVWDASNNLIRLGNSGGCNGAVANCANSDSAGPYSGSFTSRTMDATTSSSWTKLSWMSSLPFDKELPNFSGGSVQNETSANYSALVGATPATGDNNLMSGIVGLWHFNEGSYNAIAGEVKDTSGSGNHGTATVGITTAASGKFNRAADFTSGAGPIVLGNNASVQLSHGTLSLWFKATAAGGGNSYGIMGKYWAWLIYLQGNGHISTIDFNAGNTVYDSGVSATDHAWHHAVLSFQVGVPNGSHFYVDGVLTNAFTFSGIQSQANSLAIGTAHLDGIADVWNFAGYTDEAALWNTPLNSSEVLELYRRGANRTKFQVRTCTLAACADNPAWIGPDGTSSTYFSELNNNSVPLAGTGTVLAGAPQITFSALPVTVSNHRYFQYQAILESDGTAASCNYGGGATSCSPELQSVTIAPNHYDASAPTIVNKTGVSYLTLTHVIEILGGTGCSSGVLYNLSRDGTNWYYWSGAAWGVADGTVSKANTASVVQTNLASFVTQVGTGSIYAKAFLQSSGTSACALDNLEVDGTY